MLEYFEIQDVMFVPIVEDRSKFWQRLNFRTLKIFKQIEYGIWNEKSVFPCFPYA